MIAILIAFQYKDLEGAIYDLYQAYRYVKSLDFNIYIFTDIKEIKHSHHQLSDIDDDFYTFLNKENVSHVNSKSQLIASLSKIKIDKALFFYYSGHGITKGLVCPDNTIFSFTELRTFIDYQISFIILDCCHASSLDLAYEYTRERARLESVKKLTSNHIYLFTASKQEEKAKSVDNGSYFTKHFFQQLYECVQRRRKINVVSFLRDLNRLALSYGKERYGGYCSLPTLTNLPLFLFGHKEIHKVGNFYMLQK